MYSLYVQCFQCYVILFCLHYDISAHVQKELMKTKEMLVRLATNLRQLPDRYTYMYEHSLIL